MLQGAFALRPLALFRRQSAPLGGLVVADVLLGTIVGLRRRLVASAAGLANDRNGFIPILEAAPAWPWAPAIALGAFLAAHVALVPLELLCVAAGLVFAFPGGAAIALLGAGIGAAIGYAAGRAIAPADLARWMTRRSYRSVRQLGGRGIGGIAILRLLSIASAGAVHLVCGAARAPFGAYMAGSAIGLTPVVVALSVIGALVREAVLQPSWRTWLTAAGAALVLAGAAAALRTALLLRQFSPAVSHQRQRAEFG